MGQTNLETNTASEVELITDRARAFQLRMQEVEKEREAFADELIRAIHARVICLYSMRSERSLSFELWLSQRFHGESLFEVDEELQQLLESILRTQTTASRGMSIVSAGVNTLLANEGHEYGFQRYFQGVVPMGRRLTRRWRGNPPIN